MPGPALLQRWFEWLRPTPQPLGKRGERYAARWLRRRGYKIVAGGSRSRFGEIDLVAVKGETVVFVEVKTRTQGTLADALEAVDLQKQQRIVRTAMMFLRQHDLLETASRFDVVAIVWPDGASKPAIEHVVSAFSPADHGQFFR